MNASITIHDAVGELGITAMENGFKGRIDVYFDNGQCNFLAQEIDLNRDMLPIRAMRFLPNGDLIVMSYLYLIKFKLGGDDRYRFVQQVEMKQVGYHELCVTADEIRCIKHVSEIALGHLDVVDVYHASDLTVKN